MDPKEMKIERVCFCCGKELRRTLLCDTEESHPYDPPDFYYPPASATVWTTGGNYGSQLFDPVVGYTYLKINICDDCLAQRTGRVYHCKMDESDDQLIDVDKFSPPSKPADCEAGPA